MSARRSWLVRALSGAALRAMPVERRVWAQAMCAEADHVCDDERLSWAFGCLWAAIKLRFDPMNTGDYRVSRWVMLVETIGGFGPLCLGWYLLVFVAPAVIRFNGASVENFVTAVPGGGYIVAMTIVASVVGLLGPIGMLLGLRYVFTGRALQNRGFGWTLIVVAVAAHVFGLIAGVIAGPPDFEFNSFTFWFYTVMLTAVPVAVIWHLMALGRPHTRAPTTLAAAL
jgi:hypothetical protein